MNITNTKLPTSSRTPMTTGASPLLMRGTPPHAPPPRATLATPKPRIGGIIPDEGPGEAWTGGSNLVPPTMPMFLNQRRPYKYAAAKGLLDDISKGTSDKLGLLFPDLDQTTVSSTCGIWNGYYLYDARCHLVYQN